MAVDMGGTKLAVALVGSNGRVRRKIKVPVHKGAADASIQQIVDTVHPFFDELSDREEFAGIGVVIPGVYFVETGNAWAPNLWGWDPIPLRPMLESKLGVRWVIDSDRAASVLGENWMGIARGLSDVVFLAVGTGIGAGIIAGGRLLRGAGDISGAVGWFSLNSTPKEIYKQMGCFEAEAAGPSVSRRALEKISAGQNSILAASALSRPESITTEAVIAAARNNDALAKEVVAETARWLGRGVANIISLLNPQMVVLGGGLMQAGDLMWESIRREAFEWAQPLAAKQTRIEPAQLGEDAAILGAARLVFMHY